jgi:hypothetical protein
MKAFDVAHRASRWLEAFASRVELHCPTEMDRDLWGVVVRGGPHRCGARVSFSKVRASLCAARDEGEVGAAAGRWLKRDGIWCTAAVRAACSGTRMARIGVAHCN